MPSKVARYGVQVAAYGVTDIDLEARDYDICLAAGTLGAARLATFTTVHLTDSVSIAFATFLAGPMKFGSRRFHRTGDFLGHSDRLDAGGMPGSQRSHRDLVAVSVEEALIDEYALDRVADGGGFGIVTERHLRTIFLHGEATDHLAVLPLDFTHVVQAASNVAARLH